MPETHLESQPKMPKSAPKSLKAPTFIQSIRSTFSLRRKLGCSSTTAIRMSASCRPNATSSRNNSINRNSKKNANFMMPKQRKVVVGVAARNNNISRRHRQHQFLDFESPPATPKSTPTTNKSFSDKIPVLAKKDCTTSNQATNTTVTTVAMDFDSKFRLPRSGTEVIRTSQHRRVPLQSPDELVEILKRQTNLLMGISNSIDQFRDWRLDTDDMTYEQLLALGDKIGYVSTGVKESEMQHYIKRKTFLNKKSSSSQLTEEPELNCSICQEDYEAKDKLGLLKCGHSYHRVCIKQWLRHKKTCPVCKSEVEAWC